MYHRIVKTIYTGIFILFAVFTCPLYAQTDIQREVRVVKPYSPTLSDAEKINLLPDMSDTIQVQPEINYSIVPKQFDAPFSLEQIKPARMVGLPLERLYKSQLTMGVGNYFTPLAELSVNQLRSRRTAMGLNLKHHSSGGKLKLDNDVKMHAGFSDNLADLYGKLFLTRSILEAEVSGGYQTVHYYGYNTDIDTLLDKSDIRQSIISAGTKVRYYSSQIDSFRFNHNSAVGYKFTGDRFDNMEHAITIHTDLHRRFREQNIGVHLGMNHYNYSQGIDSTANTIFRLNPFISKRGNEWMFLAGFKMAADIRGQDPEFKLYPKATFEFHIVKDILVPYLDVDGKRAENNYSNVLTDNPFIVPGLSVKNSNYGIIATAGIRGSSLSGMTFNFNGSYSMIDNLHFFVNDTTLALANQFTVQYDDLLLTTLSGDINWSQSEKLILMLKGRYYMYNLEKSDYPWHKPDMEILFGTSYNLRDKILINTDIFYTGKRLALSPDPLSEYIELKPYLDANLKIEYRYTKLLSFFLRFSNFSASHYQIWNQYPVQRFQILGGFSYAL